MLIIGRRVGEAVLIGDNVEIQVMEVSGSRVKLGIAAPRTLSILRKEVRLAREENQAAVQGSAGLSGGEIAALLGGPRA
jgi:carbon storage regulator